MTPEPERAGFRRPPQHVGIFGFSQTSKCCRTTSGLPQLDHKLMSEGSRRRIRVKKAHLARRGRPINSWIPGDARVAPLRCPILRLRQYHHNSQKHEENHPLTGESVSGIGGDSRRRFAAFCRLAATNRRQETPPTVRIFKKLIGPGRLLLGKP